MQISDSMLNKFSLALLLPISRYQKQTLLFSCGSQNFSPNPAHFLISPYIGGPHKVCFVISPEYLLCGYIALSASQYLVLGPACPYEISETGALALLSKMALPASRLDEFLLFLRHIPKMSSASFSNMLDFLNELIHPKEPDTPIHLTYQVPHITPAPCELLYPPDNLYEAFEDKLSRMIRFGKTDELEAYFDQNLNHANSLPIPRLASGALRSMKNTTISSTAVCTRFAVAGGLSYRSAITLSDYYISKIESSSSYSQLMELLRSMMLDFTRRVALCREEDSDSAIVRAIYRDVQDHLHEKITTRDIAARLRKSESYLCHHFQEKTGKAITTYIREAKIREASWLLESTSLPLVSISENLGFSSQQQFQRIFKEITGQTPGTYRQNFSDPPLYREAHKNSETD